MRKGLFWVIDESGERQLVTFAAECDQNGVVIDNQFTYNSRKGDSFAHKNAWQIAAKDYPREIRNKPWNYFPRGRVEITNGKATVYFNPVLADWPEFEESMIGEFEIESFSVRFIPDHSRHYESKGTNF